MDVDAVLIVLWDERAGPRVLGSVPREIVVPRETLFQIYLNHHDATEPGFTSMANEKGSITSYFFGQDSPYYIVILANPDFSLDGNEYRLRIAAEEFGIWISQGEDRSDAFFQLNIQRLYDLLVNESEYD